MFIVCNEVKELHKNSITKLTMFVQHTCNKVSQYVAY